MLKAEAKPSHHSQSPLSVFSRGLSALSFHLAFSPKLFDIEPPQPYELNIRPIFHHSIVNEIIGKFGGAELLREAVGQLQTLLYAE